MTTSLTQPGAWWLLSRDDARRIAEALGRIAANANTSAAAQADAREALHLLESGLYRTDEVPSEWQIEPAK